MANSGLMSGGVGLLLLGIVLLVGGGLESNSCNPTPMGGGVQISCSSFGTLIGLGVLFVIIGIVLLAASASYRRRPSPPPYNPAVPPPLINPVVVQEKVEREIVRVRCRYCGSLNDETNTTCSSCGAPI